MSCLSFLRPAGQKLRLRAIPVTVRSRRLSYPESLLRIRENRSALNYARVRPSPAPAMRERKKTPEMGRGRK